MNNVPKVIDLVVNNDLCIGCGLCINLCPSSSLEMRWSDKGFLLPAQVGVCDINGACIDVCPFNPISDSTPQTENELANVFLDESDFQNEKVGRYKSMYVGYSKEFRLTSSSGGMATYIYIELLERGIVDHVVSVGESSESNEFYKYQLYSHRADVLSASKTRYFPVTLADVIPEISRLEGKVAIVGVACFIKAIRLAQLKDPALRDKISFLVGIICGGVKSRFFTEYLISKSGVRVDEGIKPEFRIKNHAGTAGDYSFGVVRKTDGAEKRIKMSTVGDMWGTGMFKANACDFCDDVTTELADISLGDAWFLPYSNDGLGNNVIVTRSNIAERIVNEGIFSGKLIIDNLSEDEFIKSQNGSFNHRHTGLVSRIEIAKNRNLIFPTKRQRAEKPSLPFKLVQSYRMKVRSKSLEIWRDFPEAHLFDTKMRVHLFQLRIFTKIYHYHRALIKRLKALFY